MGQRPTCGIGEFYCAGVGGFASLAFMELLPTKPKSRDPFLVFAAMPRKDNKIPDATAALWERVQTGNKIGPYTFLSMTLQSFSTAKSRNMLTAVARDHGAGKILMIDADMNAGDAQLERILSRPERVVGGIYPKKLVGLKPSWVVSFAKDGKLTPDGLHEAMDIGAGFLKIDMDVVDDMIVRWPKTRYLCEDDPWRGAEMFDLWAEGPVLHDWNGNKKPWPRYLTEDFYFCWRCWKLGIPVWADTKCQVGHLGEVDFLEIAKVIGILTSDVEDPVAPQNALLPPIER